MARKKKVELSDSQRRALEFLGGYDEHSGFDHSQEGWNAGAIPRGVLEDENDLSDLETLAELGLVDVEAEGLARRWKITAKGLKETLNYQGDPMMPLVEEFDPEEVTA